MRNTRRIGFCLTIAFVIILLVALNIVTFVLPFNRGDTFPITLTIYLTAGILIIAEGILIASYLFNEDNKERRVLGLPTVLVGYIALILQIIAAAAFFACNALIILPVWIVILVEVFIYALFFLTLIKGSFFKSWAHESRREVAASTRFMDTFRARLKALVGINKNPDVEKPLNNLLEMALTSDAVSNDKTVDSEGELLSCLQELDTAIREGSTEKTIAVINKTKDILFERNALCKVGK